MLGTIPCVLHWDLDGFIDSSAVTVDIFVRFLLPLLLIDWFTSPAYLKSWWWLLLCDLHHRTGNTIGVCVCGRGGGSFFYRVGMSNDGPILCWAAFYTSPTHPLTTLTTVPDIVLISNCIVVFRATTPSSRVLPQISSIFFPPPSLVPSSPAHQNFSGDKTLNHTCGSVVKTTKKKVSEWVAVRSDPHTIQFMDF